MILKVISILLISSTLIVPIYMVYSTSKAHKRTLENLRKAVKPSALNFDFSNHKERDFVEAEYSVIDEVPQISLHK